MAEKIRMTNEALDALMTKNGGYTRECLAFLGVAWPPKQGWKKRVIGNSVDRDKFVFFLEKGKEARKGSRQLVVDLLENYKGIYLDDEVYSELVLEISKILK
jgi:hypothetical protein